MKLTYQQATIGFCTDLTSPNSEIIPVANLLVGEVEGRYVAGVALLVPEHLDPLTKAVLNDTHQLVRQYVDEAFRQRSPAAPLGDVLARVYHSLRNSMHVSAIHEPAETDIAEVGQLGGSVVNLLYRGLMKALADAGLVVVATTPRPMIRPAKPMWASPSSLDLPQSLVWEPPPPNAEMSVATG
ncbi:MAG TPA: hypothetical protein VNO30_43325 [Kofleriaceae bacterium]|nr:hypothetical protein [Kofleriaceae bacterium]